jgi:GNAT superfamily N-acetyltransferase
MVKPENALESFQRELLAGRIQPQPSPLDPKLFIYVDRPMGEPRVSYARMAGKTVTAFAMFAFADPIEGTPCYGIGYAVPEPYRNQGRAKEIINAAIADLQAALGPRGCKLFYVEAIVGADNRASQRVAEQLISDTPVAVTDKLSGLPAFQYARKIERPRKQGGNAKRPKP